MSLSAEELLAGSALTFEVDVPEEVVRPGNGTAPAGAKAREATRKVRLRPLTVHDLQLISRAAKENDSLVAALMVQRSLVEPKMSVAQVSGMHVGLVYFLLRQVTRISGIDATSEDLAAAQQSPLAKAAYVLAKEFGWTPQQVGEMTLGQVLLHLQMLSRKAPS